MQDRISPRPLFHNRPSFHTEVRHTDGRHRAAHQDPLGSEPRAPAFVHRDCRKFGEIPESAKDCSENRRHTQTR